MGKKHHRHNIHNAPLPLLYLVICALLYVSCYQPREPRLPDAWDLTKQQIDSVSFTTTHHYSQGYNFVVKSDTLTLIGDMGDTLSVPRHECIVVADIRTDASDSIDSVWVKVAQNYSTMGWIHEKDLLSQVVPDDSISQAIDTFSSTHLLFFFLLFIIVAVVYLTRIALRRGVRIVHLRDIDSPYPALLAVLVSLGAVWYASIQMFAPEMWRHFYYHPTLNPLAVPLMLAVFLILLWSILIIFLAAVGETFRQLSAEKALLYLFGLFSVCALDYVVFSIITLYYIGYPLLAAYIVFAAMEYKRRTFCPYRCGECGAPMRNKGRCPQCGAVNT